MKENQDEKLHKAFESLKTDGKIDQLYEEAHFLIKKIAFSIVKSKEAAEDISQEIFAKLLNLPPNRLPIQNETCWIYTVTKNECFCYFRKQKPTLNIEEIYDVSVENEQINQLVEKESFYQVISKLPEIEKQILSLKLLSNFTFQEIGTMLEMPTATVQWRYYKSLHSLKTILSSFTGFIVTLVFGIGLYKNSKKEVNGTEQENEKEVLENELTNQSSNEIQNNKPNETNRNEQNKTNSDMENVRENQITVDNINSQMENGIQQEIVEQNDNTYCPIIVGSFLISFVFLGIAIFSIFTQKGPTKSKKKII